MPADGCGIEEHVCALKSGNACAFRVPLVPADERADFAYRCIERFKAEIAGSEVELFVIERIVGDVHLAVQAADASIFLQNDRGIVVQSRRAALKEGSNNDNFLLASNGAKPFGAGAGNGFGQIEEIMVLALTEILGAEKLRQADDICAHAGGFADALHSFVEVRVRVRRAGHLHESDFVVQSGWHLGSLKTYTAALLQDREKAQARITCASLPASILFKDEDCRSYGRCPAPMLVTNCGLRHIGGADNFVGDAIDFLLLVPALVGVEFEVECGGEHFCGQLLGVLAGLLLGLPKAVVLA